MYLGPDCRQHGDFLDLDTTIVVVEQVYVPPFNYNLFYPMCD